MSSAPSSGPVWYSPRISRLVGLASTRRICSWQAGAFQFQPTGAGGEFHREGRPARAGRGGKAERQPPRGAQNDDLVIQEPQFVGRLFEAVAQRSVFSRRSARSTSRAPEVPCLAQRFVDMRDVATGIAARLELRL